jgi:hypothetical protein
MRNLTRLFFLILALQLSLKTNAQNEKGRSTKTENTTIDYGVKGGFQYSWVRMDDPAQQAIVTNKPVPGFNVGFVLSFKVKKRFYLHSELLYSTKGKRVVGITDPTLEDNVTYRYLELPLLYNAQFTRTLNSERFKQFKYYIGAGPLFSYWLGGSGTINNSLISELGLPPINYNLKFGKRGDDLKEVNTVYVSDANRLQIGFNIGAGIMLEPNNGKKIMLDARFEFGQSWLGKATSTNYVLPANYNDNLKSSNMGLRLSVMYLFEANIDKKTRNMGKSKTGKGYSKKTFSGKSRQ